MIFYYVANCSEADMIDSIEANSWDDVIEERFKMAFEADEFIGEFGNNREQLRYAPLLVQKAVWEHFENSFWYPIPVSDADGDRYDALEELQIAIRGIQRQSSDPHALADYYWTAYDEQNEILKKYTPVD